MRSGITFRLRQRGLLVRDRVDGGRRPPALGHDAHLDRGDAARVLRRVDSFVALRDRLDPEGRFRNAHLDRVLGVPATCASPT